MEKQVIIAIGVLCLSWHVHAQVNCTATGAGRFAESGDASCKNYTLCVLNSSTGDYTSYNYVCPTTSLFNPNTGLCTTNYVCPNITTNSTTSECTEDGFIADSSSTNCSSYIQCVDEGNGTFSETTLTCPSSTYYDPSTTLCDSDYSCTFTCTNAGRFADSTDTTCQAYHFCVLVSNGTYITYDYTCPGTSVFNPTTSLCTTTYTCPTA